MLLNRERGDLSAVLWPFLGVVPVRTHAEESTGERDEISERHSDSLDSRGAEGSFTEEAHWHSRSTTQHAQEMSTR
jgi:hypothetical protein